MAYKNCISALSIALAFSTLPASADRPTQNDYPPLDEEFTYSVGEKSYTIRYLRNETTHSVEKVAYDSTGARIDYADLPRPKRPLVSQELQHRLDDATSRKLGEQKHKVTVALKSPNIPVSRPQSSSMRMEEGEVVFLRQDNIPVAKDEHVGTVQRRQEATRKSLSNQRQYRVQRITEIRDSIANRHEWFTTAIGKSTDEFSGYESLTLELTSSQILELAEKSSDLVEGIDLHKPAYDNIQTAMDATGIDPWALDYPGRDGDGIGIYMTETGCPNANHITGYTRLGSPPRTNHSEMVSSIIRAVAPESWIYCRGDIVLPRTSDLDGVGGRPPIHIANISAGRRDESSYQVFDRDWDNLVYNERVAVFASAGNQGDPGESNEIDSPGKGYNVVTVGSFSDTNDWYSDFTSDENPDAGQIKPDVLAPGENITAAGHVDSGTSFASPHAAAFAADLMSDWMQYAPATLKATFLATSVYDVGGVSQGTVGAEGIDFNSAFYNGYFHKWSGSNSDFNTFAANDDGSTYGMLEIGIDLSASMNEVRIAFAYLNRGSRAYQYPSHHWGLGTSYKMEVRDPNGNRVDYTPISTRDPYLLLEIDPTISGEYLVRIERMSNSDAYANFIAGLSVTW